MNGFICLNKDSGITSFLASAKVKRITASKKAGHTGTLDPLATGVLPIALGGASRFINFLCQSDKHYEARFITGIKTDTLDITGTVIERTDKTASYENIVKLLPRFTGDIQQIPPMFSAIKKDGVRLYELARKGQEIERESRAVRINEISVNKINENDFSLFVSCSTGTYIRTLISDIGDALGCFATMTALTRTFTDGFHISESHTIKELEARKSDGTLSEIILPIEKALDFYPKVYVTSAQSERFNNGGELFLNRLTIDSTKDFHTVFSPYGKFIGIGKASHEKGVLEVKKVYNEL